jgi:rhodanese-related sulfurtransferase
MRRMVDGLLLLVLTSLATSVFAQEDYPGRKLYQDVEIVTIEQLKGMPAGTHIVDVRSPYEYETIHIKDAINIPISLPDFVKSVRDLRRKSPNPIIFYCNGHTCYKSYNAVRKAQVFGVGDVFSFDAGIFDWARAVPERTVLLGESPIDPTRLISKEDHAMHLLSPDEFKRRVESKQYAVIDVRSRVQRGAVGLFSLAEKWASLEAADKLNTLLREYRDANKPLLIYDNVGKQVPWLEYRLRAMGVKDYYFMKGGAEAYFKAK